MAHFYGVLKSKKGESTRCGTKTGGLRATVKGWQGSIEICVFHENGVDRYEIYRLSEHGVPEQIGSGILS